MANSYWTIREKSFVKAYEKLGTLKIAKTEKELQKQYIRISKKLIEDLELKYLQLLDEIKKGEPLVSHLYQYNKYYEMLNNVQKELLKLGISENKILSQNLTDMYKDNVKLIGSSFNITTSINADRVEKVIASTWVKGGVHWSTSIWNSQAMLTESIREGLIDCVAMGRTTDDFAKMLMSKFNVSFKQAKRLARTELMHVQTQSSLDKYSEAGIEYYEILVGNDEKTCEECLEYDGKRYKLEDSEIGVNAPPFHPNCRCTIIPVVD